MIGFGEIALILLVVLIVFGAGKLPHVMGDLGKGLKSFKEGMKDDTPSNSSSSTKKDEAPPSA